MKKSIILFSFLTLLGTAVFGQNDFNILEQPLPYQKYASSFTTDIIGTNESFVIYNWQKFIEKHKGTTYLISYGQGDVEFESEHVTLPFLNNKSVTLHSRVSPNVSKTGVLLTIWIEMENGEYFSGKTDKDAATKIKQWLRDFDQQLMDKNNVFKN